ncbi:MAG: hypothetical protein OSJ52_02040 [Lachnospiraceae bacterium]|nr:hypothetical protein [Lachnospiraceae bacterium]
MRVYSCGFIYNEISSDKMGVMLCNFGRSGLETTSAGEKIELSTQKLSGRDRWYHYSSTFGEALSFTLHIIKTDKSRMERHEIAEYSRWLQRRDGYKKFQFLGTEFAGIEFYAIATELNELSVGNVTYGLEVKMMTDAPYGVSAKLSKTISFTGDNTYTDFNHSDEYGYLYPDLNIVVQAAGDLTITNQFEARQTVIRNCQAGELLTLNGELRQITSSKPYQLEDRFNWKWLRFCKTDKNSQNILSASLPCIVTVTYRNIRKVGVS